MPVETVLHLARELVRRRVWAVVDGDADHPEILCDAAVLRRAKRRELARLRAEAEPVDAAAVARFLLERHGIGARRGDLLEAVATVEGLPLDPAELEAAILPARVPGFRAADLDALGAAGEVAWVGRGPGRVVLALREDLATLVDPPEAPAGLSEGAVAVLRALERRGASFLADLAGALTVDRDEALAALRELVAAGLVTNDTLAPFRQGVPKRRGGAGPATRRGRGGRGRAASRRRARARASAGRWSLVARLLAGVEEPDPTTRRFERASLLLLRHGLAAAPIAAFEGLPGGFEAIRPVLARMEEAGTVRRGRFVAGLPGATFAEPETVEALRAARDRGERGEAVVIAATDPANPYGAWLPWPPAATPIRREPGVRLLLLDGRPALACRVSPATGRPGDSLVPFAILDERPELARPAVEALVAHARRRFAGAWVLARVGGLPAAASPLAPILLECGFARDPRGLALLPG